MIQAGFHFLLSECGLVEGMHASPLQGEEKLP